MLWRSKGYLPVKSPHIGPPSTFASIPIPPTWTGFASVLRNRLLVSTVVAACGLLALLSLFPRAQESSQVKSSTSFPLEGLSDGLYKLLEPIQLRQFVLEPVTIEWTTETWPDQPVPWSMNELLPTRDANLAWYRHEVLKKGKSTPKLVDGEPIPRHRIDVFPRKVELAGDKPYPAARDLMFGMTTTVERAKKMSELWTHWLLNPDRNDDGQVDGASIDGPACMILLSNQEDPMEVNDLRRVLAKRGLSCGIRTSDHERYEVRVLSMTREMRDYAANDLGRDFKWYVFNDDDTFWMDLLAVRRMLGKYDPSESWFVGATTESKNQLEQFGRMAFGGAGMLVSDPLMAKMYELWDKCYEHYRHIFGGDEMITRCAALAKGATKQTVTTEERGLHQFDVPGDTTGMLQSGIPFLNLHHYLGGGWVHIFGYGSYRDDFSQIQLVKGVVSFLGPDNMFKRYVFGNGRWLLVLGYSITIFEEKLTKEMMSEMEHTWYDGYRLSFDDRPLIPERRGDEGKPAKQTFYIDNIQVKSPQMALLTYVQADAWHEHLSSEDRVRLQVLWDGCWQGGLGCYSQE